MVTPLVRRRTGQATGVLQEIGLTGHRAAGLSQDILPACHTKYPWKSPMLGCSDSCHIVPQLLPRYFCTYKMMGANLKSENWKWQSIRATEKHSAPPTAPWQSFYRCFLVRWWHHAMWWLVYLEKQSKGEAEFELKEGSLDQFNRIVQVVHWQDNINS